MNNEKAKLLLKLEKVKDEVTRKLIIKDWLSYHFESGEKLKNRRSVEICSPKYCVRKDGQCVMMHNVEKYDFCYEA